MEGSVSIIILYQSEDKLSLPKLNQAQIFRAEFYHKI